MTITGTTRSEQTEKLIRPLLADRDGQVHVTLENDLVSDDCIDALFSELMAVGDGDRRPAAGRRVEEPAARARRRERGARSMRWPGTIDLDLRFGMLAPPLAAQTGCRDDVLQHEQQDADCIARLAVRGIATDGEVHKMRQRLVKRIVKTVIEDTRPQTLGTSRKDPDEAGAAAGTKQRAPHARR